MKKLLIINYLIYMRLLKNKGDRKMKKKDDEKNIEETLQFLEENEILLEQEVIDKDKFENNINDYFEEK